MLGDLLAAGTAPARALTHARILLKADQGEEGPASPDARIAEALETSVSTEPRVRRWRRYQAVLVVVDGQTPAAVAFALGCSVASVYGWAAAWRREGLAGLREGDHGGGKSILEATGVAVAKAFLAVDPRAHGQHAIGWTVPLLRTELATRGSPLSEKTPRRTLLRLGLRWKRPNYVLGRPDPAYWEKRAP